MEEKFEYNYNSLTIEEKKEIEKIKNQYMLKDDKTNKIERVRYLHNKVNNIPMIYGLSLGIIGTLIFGLGLTFFLEWIEMWYIGLPIGIFGVLLISVAYPIYQKLHRFYNNKYREEIIRLSDEILDE